MTDQNMNESNCPFTIVPLDGMDFVQQNFAKYKDGDRAAVDFVGHERIPLSKRFSLIERGFVLQLKDDVVRRSHFEGVKCVLKCEKPVYALSTNTGAGEKAPKRRSFLPKENILPEQAGSHRVTASCATKATAHKQSTVGDGGDAPPLAQMQNLQVTEFT